jgi:glycine cleavage system H protein
MAYPTNYRYTKEHEWLDVSGNTGTIGITDYAQSTLGDIVFVELPKVGDTVTGGATFGSVESVKAVSDLYSPVSGTVTAINEELTTAPGKINSDANTMWLLKLTLKDTAELDGLLDAAAYEAFVAEEAGH